ncbi:MAG: hypothetical protein ACTS5I_16115 [Rhodanobacter sp.]
MKAVEYIANAMFAELDRSTARKRVRERIRYGQKKGLPLIFKGDVTYPEFWFWAGDMWPTLRHAEGYPAKPPVGDALRSSARAGSHILDFVGPGDLPRAQAELNDCQQRAGRLNRALLRALAQGRRLKSALKTARDTVAELEAKREDTSRNHSDAGKLAAGVPRRRS